MISCYNYFLLNHFATVDVYMRDNASMCINFNFSTVYNDTLVAKGLNYFILLLFHFDHWISHQIWEQNLDYLE